MCIRVLIRRCSMASEQGGTRGEHKKKTGVGQLGKRDNKRTTTRTRLTQLRAFAAAPHRSLPQSILGM